MIPWTTITLKVVTPLFSGDDPTAPPSHGPGSAIRVPSIRGQLRFWFRAVASGAGVSNPAELWTQEEEVFGSVRDGKTTSSAIALRVDRQPVPERKGSAPGWTKPPNNDGITYLLGPGLWNNGRLDRGYLKPGSKIELKIRLSADDTINTRFFYAMWAWLTFGGLGARIHRGFGRLEAEAETRFDEFFPHEIWDGNEIQTRPRTVEEWKALIERPIPDSVKLTDIPHDWHPTSQPMAQRPEWPILDTHHSWWNARVLRVEADSWSSALNEAGEQWRKFLLCNNIKTHRNGRPRRNSTPEWNETIIGADNRFPRGALGLPVVYNRPDNGQPSFRSTVGVANNEYRRASPVWIVPVQLGNKRWTVLTHAFNARLIPDKASIVADGDAGDKILYTTDADVDEAIRAWTTDSDRPERRIPKNYFS